MDLDKKILSEILVKDYGVVTFEDNYYLMYCYIDTARNHFESRKYGDDEIIVMYFAGHYIIEQISVIRYKSYIREKNLNLIENGEKN